MDWCRSFEQFCENELNTSSSFRALDARGVFWGKTQDAGHALALLFRPTGVTFNGRQGNIARVDELTRQYTRPPMKIRFGLEICTEGEGAGGVEAVAFSKPVEDPVPANRLDLLIDDLWIKPLDLGTRVGSVGWIPRELTPLLRPMLHDAPHCISHFTCKLAQYQYTFSTLLLCLVIYRLSEEDEDLARGMLDSYELVCQRTHIGNWRGATLSPAWVLPPGFELELDDQ